MSRLVVVEITFQKLEDLFAVHFLSSLQILIWKKIAVQKKIFKQISVSTDKFLFLAAIKPLTKTETGFSSVLFCDC